jgi:uncharacterized membrane protein
MMSLKRLSAVVSVFLGLLVLGAAVAVGVTMASPPPREPFTEFYILGAGGVAADYPTEFAAGEVQTVSVGIVSHEPGTAAYRVDVEIGGSVLASAGPVVLEPLERYEGPLTFTANSVGRQKLTFLLYKDEQPEAYRSVYLWVDVAPNPVSSP